MINVGVCKMDEDIQIEGITFYKGKKALIYKDDKGDFFIKNDWSDWKKVDLKLYGTKLIYSSIN